MRVVNHPTAAAFIACAAVVFIALPTPSTRADERPAFEPIELEADAVAAFDKILVDLGGPASEARRQPLKTAWAKLDTPHRQAMLYRLLLQKPKPANNWYWRHFEQVYKDLGPGIAPVVRAALASPEADVRERACEVAGEIGFDQQGPRRLDERFEPLLASLIERMHHDASEAVRLAAVRAVWRFHSHPAPHAHEMTQALKDPDPKVRKAAAEGLSKSGPVAALYFDLIVSQFDYVNDRKDAEAVGRICENLGYIRMDVGLALIEQIRRMPAEDNDASWLAYPINLLPPSDPVRDAILTLPIRRLRNHEFGYWIAEHARGDHRFVKPLLAALELDWVDDDEKREPTCFYSGVLCKALASAGRDHPQLVEQMRRQLQEPMPTNARLKYADALAELTDDPAPRGDALVYVLKNGKENAATYTRGHVINLLARLDRAQVERLQPYLPKIEALVAVSGQDSPIEFWLATGRTESLLKWARWDLKRTRNSGISSGVIDGYGGAAYDMGPLMSELREELRLSLVNGSDHIKHDASHALVALGPDELVRQHRELLVQYAEQFKPVRRVEPAMALWAGLHDTDAALKILIPLLDDQSWATTWAATRLAKMGRDAAPAIPALQKLATGPNPAYAHHATLAVVTIHADVNSEPTFDALWAELGDDDYYTSIRALWRLVDRGGDTAATIRQRLAQPDDTTLPGKRQRLEARAQQVLERIEAND